MATKGKTKQPAKPAQKKTTDAEVAALRKEVDSLKLENSILRKDFVIDPTKSGVAEDTLIAQFEDTVKKLEVQLKEAQERKPESSAENNDKSLKELQQQHSKEINTLKRQKEELEKKNKNLENENKEINSIHSTITRERDDFQKEVEKLKQQSTEGNSSAELERAKNEIKSMKDDLRAITKERDDYKKEVEKLNNSASEQQSMERNVSDELETAKTEIKKIKDDLSKVTAERDDYKEKLKTKETLNKREPSMDQYPIPAEDDPKDKEKENKMKTDAEIHDLKKKIIDLENENEVSTADKADLKKQLSDLKKECETLNQKLQQERTDKAAIEKQRKELEEKKKSLNQSLTEKGADLEKEKETNAALQKELAKAEEDLKKANSQNKVTSASSDEEELKKLRMEIEEKKKLVNELQSKCHDAFEKLEKSGKEMAKMKKEHAALIERKEATIAELKRKNNVVEPRGQSSSGDVLKLKKEIIGLKEEKDHLKTRLSELVGAKLTENNPDIADLSDMNRPQKLGEMYSELYDNEWTDAFEEIEACGESESVVIKQLLSILWEASAFCEELSSRYIKDLDSVLFKIPGGKENNTETSEMPVTIRKQIKDLRKGISPFLKANVSEEYVQTSKRKKIGENLKHFMKRCAELCWLMRMQDPPVVLTKKGNAGPFIGDLYRTYTKSGTTVDFVVWPPLLLHDNGPTLAKGVAQGK